MQLVSPLRRASSTAIRSSIRWRHPRVSRCQSWRLGARSAGSPASAVAISSRLSPTRWAMRMKAIRRSTSRRNRRWPPGAPLGVDQTALLVEADGRGGQTAPVGHLSDGEELIHDRDTSRSLLGDSSAGP